MGSNFATDLASGDLGLSMSDSIRIHLSSNHYPPVPATMVQPCLDAIDAYFDEDYQRPIQLPMPITWKNKSSAPASAIVEAHHLEAWLPDWED